MAQYNKRNLNTSSERTSYQKNSPLTKYVERVCGINSTASTTNKQNQKLRRKKYHLLLLLKPQHYLLKNESLDKGLYL